MPKFQSPMLNSQAIVRVSGGLIRVDTHRGNEEIFLNRHSQGTNSQTITQVIKVLCEQTRELTHDF